MYKGHFLYYTCGTLVSTGLRTQSFHNRLNSFSRLHALRGLSLRTTKEDQPDVSEIQGLLYKVICTPWFILGSSMLRSNLTAFMASHGGHE